MYLILFSFCGEAHFLREAGKGHSRCVMDCHATARGSIPSGNSVKTEIQVLRKGQLMGVPSLNDLAVNGMLNTTNQPTNPFFRARLM